MADLIGTVVGGGSQTTENREVDPLTQQLNQMKVDQVKAMLGYPGYGQWQPAGQFLQPSSAYTPSPQVQDLFNAAVRPLYSGPSMSLGDYRDLGMTAAANNLRDAQLTQNSALSTARGAAGYDLNQGINTLGNVLSQQSDALGNVLAARNAATQNLFGQGQTTLQDFLNQGSNRLASVLGTQQSTLANALGQGQTTLRDVTGERQNLADALMNRELLANQNVFNTQRDTNLQGLNLASGRNEANFNNLFDTMKTLGLDTSQNYIRQIATPQIMQQMALQGLEGGGAVESAIAKASAEYGMPVVQMLGNLAGQFQGAQAGLGSQYLGGEQNIAGQYGQNTAASYARGTQNQAQALSDLFGGNLNLLGQYNQGLQSALGQYGAGQQALYGQYGSGLQNLLGYLNQGTQAGYDQYGSGMTSLLGQYGGNVGNLLNQYNAGDLSLLGQYMGNTANLSQGYNQGTLNFIGSLPSAQQTLQLTPAQTATALFPLADYSGQLQREDLMRRQGLFGTALTGLPYTPGGSVTQEKQTPSLFSNFTGIGSNSGFFGKGTGFF